VRRLTTSSARFDIANFSHDPDIVSLDCRLRLQVRHTTNVIKN
jgi:hypothetical protein